MKMCAAEDCRKPFLPNHGRGRRGRFCSQRCAMRFHQRRWRAAHPDRVMEQQRLQRERASAEKPVGSLEPRICAADDCENLFTPRISEQKFCSPRCASRVRVRALRARRRLKLDPLPPGGGGGGGRTIDFHGEGLSIRWDDSLPVIGPNESPTRKPPAPAKPEPEPQRSLVDAA